MNPGDSVKINATVLRVEGKRLDAQTADGQLIQTDVSNAMSEEKNEAAVTDKQQKGRTAENKSVGLDEHKAERPAPENKSGEKTNHRGR